jgi:hypothetical protein
MVCNLELAAVERVRRGCIPHPPPRLRKKQPGMWCRPWN